VQVPAPAWTRQYSGPVALPRKFLNEDEELLAELRPHWVFFLGPLVTAIVADGAIIGLLVALGNRDEWATYPLLAVAAIPLLWLLGRMLRWVTYTLALTTTRVVVRHGVFDRDIVQLRLQRITEINLSQKLWERAVGTGRLIIDVQGEDDSLVLEFVRKPAIVQRVINAQINELVGGGSAEDVPLDLLQHDRRRTIDHEPPSDDTPPHGVPVVTPGNGPAAAATPPTAPQGASHADIRDRLVELDDLRQRGILTEEEFAAKKAELLNRI
jgi:PH (Pleckstrin Homology) domain-containing protein/putative oligomerization/nucleic acid binding protein